MREEDRLRKHPVVIAGTDVTWTINAEDNGEDFDIKDVEMLKVIIVDGWGDVIHAFSTKPRIMEKLIENRVTYWTIKMTGEDTEKMEGCYHFEAKITINGKTSIGISKTFEVIPNKISKADGKFRIG